MGLSDRNLQRSSASRDFRDLLPEAVREGDGVRQALTHRSAGGRNNERLEFLGDAVLGLVIADALYEQLPDAPEGDLTRLRAALVNRESLAPWRESRDWKARSISARANARAAVSGAIPSSPTRSRP